jgi:hypothetical protein
MRRENIAEYNWPSNDAFASVVRSFGETNSRFQALVVQSVGRAVEIQSQFVGKAYDTYVSEISKLGRMFVAGYSPFTARPQELPHANLNGRQAAGSRPREATHRRPELDHQTQDRNCREEPVRLQEIGQGEEESRFSPPGQKLASVAKDKGPRFSWVLPCDP